jgi:L-fuconolactonase
MRIDAHQHFWQWSKGWFSRPEPVFSRDYLPKDFEYILKAEGIDKTIVVQTSPTVGETDFLLDLAASSTFIAGVVGWLDLESPQFQKQLEEHLRCRHFVAVRPMLESLPDDNWILRPRVMESLAAIAEARLVLEFLTLTRHLPYVVPVLDKMPRLRAVIDHLSKPEIKTGNMHPWQELMREIALRPNVYCKLSGMVTEADYTHWTPEQLRPYAEHVLEHFGPDRVMFGSDWPVCLLAANYAEVLNMYREFVTGFLGTAALDAVFGGNAARFYRLNAHL